MAQSFDQLNVFGNPAEVYRVHTTGSIVGSVLEAEGLFSDGMLHVITYSDCCLEYYMDIQQHANGSIVNVQLLNNTTGYSNHAEVQFVSGVWNQVEKGQGQNYFQLPGDRTCRIVMNGNNSQGVLETVTVLQWNYSDQINIRIPHKKNLKVCYMLDFFLILASEEILFPFVVLKVLWA